MSRGSKVGCLPLVSSLSGAALMPPVPFHPELSAKVTGGQKW